VVSNDTQLETSTRGWSQPTATNKEWFAAEQGGMNFLATTTLTSTVAVPIKIAGKLIDFFAFIL
jgi:hypothetical protein